MTTLHDILLDLGKHHVSVRYDDNEIERAWITYRNSYGETQEADITDLIRCDARLWKCSWSAIRAEQQEHAEAVREAREDR